MRSYFLISNRYSVVAGFLVCLIAAAHVAGQTGTGEDRSRPTKTAAPKPSRNHREPRDTSRARYEARERARRIRLAEEAAAETRATEARIAEERREREQVWQIAIVANRTNGPMPYQIRENGSYETFTLSPGYQRTHTIKGPCIGIRFDNNYEEGYQEKKYSLHSIEVVGHRPTESEKANAKVNYFEAGQGGEIHLYAESK